MELKELETNEEFKRAFPVMRQLCDHLNEEQYLTLLSTMRKEGYRLLSLMDEKNEIMSVAGVAIRTDFFNGKHLWIHDLVTSKETRSQGLGKILAAHLEKFARNQGCEKVVLYSGISREQAHHFWQKHMNFDKRGIVFKKEL